MRTRIALSVLAVLVPSLAVAQEPGGDAATTARSIEDAAVDVPEFDKIRTPDSPALVILGASPTQIQRPTTPREMSISLGAFMTGGEELAIPESLALELAPYWLVAHPELTVADYGKGGPSTLWRQLTVSVGTTSGSEASTDPMTPAASNTDLALGVRTSLYRGAPRKSCAAQVEGLPAALEKAAAESALRLSPAEDDALRLDAVPATRRAELEERAKLTPDEEQAIRAQHPTAEAQAQALDEARARKRRVLLVESMDAAAYALAVKALKAKRVEAAEAQLAKVDQLFTKCAELEAARKDLVVDAAAAWAWRFPEATAEDGRFLSWAAWLSVAYVRDGISVVVLARSYNETAAGDGADHYGDLGVQAVIARKRYAASLEIVGRLFLDKPDDDPRATGSWHAALAAEYLLREGTWLTLSFGKDFASDEAGSLFSTANLKWGFGKPSVKRAGTP